MCPLPIVMRKLAILLRQRTAQGCARNLHLFYLFYQDEIG